ncbi:hypothetical protein B0T25DRAFT_562858 [Lasiosphaeria hispida]|uniref:Uncharacterized protein n=1 Tax=Lasiosphaeria hispida TaxID=260671 RepID=A0AAJ0HWB2_9PEZI|nr:hypothetical protein B0T25DRAFT_562858 [Lasiosphaeria hispida]
MALQGPVSATAAHLQAGEFDDLDDEFTGFSDGNEHFQNKASYTLPELKGLFARAGPRGTAIFETLIENVAAVDELRRRLANLTATVPNNTNFTSFYEIKPTHSIILITKNLNIESEIFQTIGQGILKWDVKETAAYSFTPVRASHREKRSRTVENTVDIAISFDNEDLRQSIAFAGEYWPSGFPAFKIDSHFTRASDLEGIIGKKTWRHPMEYATLTLDSGSRTRNGIPESQVSATSRKSRHPVLEGRVGDPT